MKYKDNKNIWKQKTPPKKDGVLNKVFLRNV
jgi:hypothetical protein